MGAVVRKYDNVRTKKRKTIAKLRRTRDIRNKHIRKLILVDRRIDVLAKLAGYRFDPFHDALWDHYEEHDTEMALGPRGWGKTTTDTILPICLEVLIDRNVRILLGSETVTQAEDFLLEAKAILTHPNVAEVFGDLKGDKWNESEITVAGRTITSKEPTVMCTGVDGAVTSKHFDHIFLDDLVSLKSSRTKGGRTKTYNWYYMTLLPCITDEQTKLRIRGTCYHPEDQYSYLMKNDPRFMDSTIIVPALTSEGESNNPTVHSTEWLTSLRDGMPRVIWNAQYQQDSSGVQGSIFEEDHFKHVAELPRGLIYFIGVDLATGKKKGVHAKKAVVVIGIHPQTFKIYLAAYSSGHWKEKRLDKVISDYADSYDPLLISVEANAYQASKIETLEDNPDTSHYIFFPVYTQHDKPTRAKRMAGRYETGKIYHLRSEKGQEMEAHLMGVPDSGEWDLFDAMDVALEGAIRRRKKRKKKRREPGVVGAQKRYNQRRNQAALR